MSSSSTEFPKLVFSNSVLNELPVDPLVNSRSRIVPNAVYSRVLPESLDNPKLIITSRSALELIGIDPSTTSEHVLAEYLSCNKVIDGSDPAAHCYCGHQFGYFSGQLGDGAAMYLGEVVNSKNEHWELQLKGSGKTPYSRQSDGRKVLRSSIREFLGSESHHALGIPTTRSGSVVTSDTKVIRDIFYTGNPIEEKATVISRMAPSFLRIGSFEIFKAEDPVTGMAGPSAGNKKLLEDLFLYTLRHHFPHILQLEGRDAVHTLAVRAAQFIREVARRSAYLSAQWQAHGWCHGVLNTDNISIHGITIDFGPYGWMDTFQPDYICNSSDSEGRYSFSNQPGIMYWDLERLHDVFEDILRAPFISSEYGSLSKEEKAVVEGKISEEHFDKKSVLSEFFPEFSRIHAEIMRRKLGLGLLSAPVSPQDAMVPMHFKEWEAKEKIDYSAPSFGTFRNPMAPAERGGLTTAGEDLLDDLKDVMQATGADFTTTIRSLALLRVHELDDDPLLLQLPLISEAAGSTASSGDPTSQGAQRLPTLQESVDITVRRILSSCASADELAASLRPEIEKSRLETFLQMAESMPSLANRLPDLRGALRRHAAADMVQGRSAEEREKQDILIWKDFIAKFKNVVCEEVDSNTHNPEALKDHFRTRRRVMLNTSPRYVLRNWFAQVAIKAAEAGDYTPLHTVYDRLMKPFASEDEELKLEFAGNDQFNDQMLDWGRRYVDSHSRNKRTVDDVSLPPSACSRPSWASGLKVSCSS